MQIGGRTPEPIPQVSETGEVHGMRTDEEGKPLTTSLSAEGEEQLGKIATSTAAPWCAATLARPALPRSNVG